MASVYDLKPRFQALLRPLIGRLARAGVTPNAVTLAAVAGSVAVGGLVALARDRPALLLLLPVWLFLRMALNAIDGAHPGRARVGGGVRRLLRALRLVRARPRRAADDSVPVATSR